MNKVETADIIRNAIAAARDDAADATIRAATRVIHGGVYTITVTGIVNATSMAVDTAISIAVNEAVYQFRSWGE